MSEDLEHEQFQGINGSLGLVVVQCFNTGFGELWVENGERVQTFPMLRLLSSGIERLAKIVLQMGRIRDGKDTYGT